MGYNRDRRKDLTSFFCGKPGIQRGGRKRKQHFTSKKATMTAPTMTKAEFSAAHRIREMDRPPISVFLSMSGHLVKEGVKKLAQK